KRRSQPVRWESRQFHSAHQPTSQSVAVVTSERKLLRKKRPPCAASQRIQVDTATTAPDARRASAKRRAPITTSHAGGHATGRPTRYPGASASELPGGYFAARTGCDSTCA